MAFPQTSTLLKEVAAGLALLLIAALLVVILVDQARHMVSEDYRAEQRIKHSFLCYDQSVDKTEEQGEFAEAQVKIGALMDVARQEVAPTDTFGKLSQFALCADFTKVGAGGLEITGPKAETARLRKVKADHVAQMIGELQLLKREIDDFPGDIHAELMAVLVPLQEAAATREPEQGTPGRDPQVTAPDAQHIERAWLLITGADQKDSEAAFQVRSTQKLVDGLAPELKQQAGAAQLYLVRSWRRTVVPFKTQEAADAALVALKGKLRYGGYVRSNFAWCPDLGPADAIEGITAIRCVN